ncbi:MAG: hypothetical protein PHD09_07380 [Candidatus Omnitrophica bacterium]|jgi:hypothetical protein|nr:hypothetical protein [Candidatus Omnitrophota bacterium]
MKLFSFVLIAAIFFSGCSSYQLASERKTGGIEDISPASFTVNFCGNAYMSQEEAKKYALQQAAERTLAKGFSHFVVMKEDDDSQFCTLDPSQSYKPMSRDRTQGSTEFIFPAFVKPNVTFTIQCFSGPEKLPEDAIDAKQYLQDNFPGLIK